jgi:iron complex outermembrane receptor protein
LETTYNFGYTDAVYTELNLSQNGTEANLKGNHQVFTPGVTSFFALQYTVPLVSSRLLRLVIRVEWAYLGKEYFDLANSITQSPYNLLNARLGLAAKHVELYFWERNIGDTKYIAYAYDFGAVHLGNPKTFGLTFKVSL